jgi:hypothetical protein
MREHASGRRGRPWQFTLGGLMSFVVGWSAYFSVIGMGCRFLADLSPEDGALLPSDAWSMGATTAGCWIVLWLLYRSWGLRQALRIHYAGPMIFAPLSLLIMILSRGPGLEPIVAVPLAGVLYVCLVSILFGFPIATIMLFFRRPVAPA